MTINPDKLADAAPIESLTAADVDRALAEIGSWRDGGQG